MHLDLLNRFGVTHGCDGRTDRQNSRLSYNKCRTSPEKHYVARRI